MARGDRVAGMAVSQVEAVTTGCSTTWSGTRRIPSPRSARAIAARVGDVMAHHAR
ncbi:hypothetical protein ACFY1L_05490 [Streptomyces sp. NPDC001663]|uniref:hypothetical protein n=1 Tax=Streptomyces sp. NPDC001663 TaxID=3364597 RepID=UPI0036B028B8